MPSIHLTSGTVEYVDSNAGTPGPVLVLGHGVPMTSALQWRKVTPLLTKFRCVQPVLPLGGHRIAMDPEADLSQFGVARLLGELIEKLDLRDVCLVLNDWGGGQFLLTRDYPGSRRVTRLALVACEAFDNFPPPPARPLAAAARTSATFWLALQLLRLRRFRRSRAGYGAMSTQGLPDDVLTAWFAPAWSSSAVRRDFAKFARGAPSTSVLTAESERLRHLDIPALVVWAAQDRMMPAEHGPRLTDLLPQAQLHIINDAATLIPEDQPEQLARVLDDFLSRSHERPTDVRR